MSMSEARRRNVAAGLLDATTVEGVTGVEVAPPAYPPPVCSSTHCGHDRVWTLVVHVEHSDPDQSGVFHLTCARWEYL